MWLFLGISAIIFTGFNLICSFKSKNEKWFRFGAISFTALTICSFYSDGAMRVLNEDWGGLMDIMPTMSKALWVCVGISILAEAHSAGLCVYNCNCSTLSVFSSLPPLRKLSISGLLILTITLSLTCNSSKEILVTFCVAKSQ